MASKTSKKNPPTKLSNVIVTRRKAVLENRKVRGRPRKNVKPLIKEAKNEIISPKNNKIASVRKDTPLQSKVKTLVKFVERVEYYPDKLKRDISNKKVLLKPIHNYKIIAASNKRKLTVPQKGINTPTKIRTNAVPQEPSMIEIVKLIEDNHNLSDEDFMEILTCPSPVWWEDPPDDEFIEDAICTRDPDSTEQSYNIMNITKQNIIEKNTTKHKNKKHNDKNTQIENQKRNVNNTITSEKFNIKFIEKKQKLENVLGNIKNRSNLIKNDEIKNDSNSTDGDMSDLSYNEDEILKNLENLDIPVLQTNKNSHNNFKIYIKDAETINNELILDKECNEMNLNKEQNEILTIDNTLVPKILPPLKRKPFLNNEIKNKNINLCSDYMSESDFRLLTNNEILHKNNEINNKNLNIDSQNNTSTENYEFKEKQIKMYFENEDNEISNKTPINELAEYVTVYKIVSNDGKKKKIMARSQESMANKKNMNSFFKQCKNNKRLKKSCTMPASSKNLNLEKENSDEKIDCSENQQKTCEYCVVKAQNGGNNFSCADCEKSPLFCCNICFTTEKPVSSCKEVARMSWKHNFLVNET